MSASARASPTTRTYPTIAADGIAWEFAASPAGVVAIGDLQGDVTALDAIARANGLVDPQGRWRGGQQHLVVCGDLIGGHDDGLLCARYVMRLQREARRCGGMVHALLGNHDLVAARGETTKWTRGERRRYRQTPQPGAPSAKAGDAYRGDSELARWLRSRNAIVRIGDSLFVHAGLGSWWPVTTPPAVNATIRAWIAHWQGRAPAPPLATRWAVGVPGMERSSRWARGPLWTRVFKATEGRRRRGAPTRNRLAAWLDAGGVRRLVLGHAPIDGPDILLVHPYYGDRVVLLDTRIVDARHGSMTALRLEAGRPMAMRVAPARRDPGCRQRELARLLVAGMPWWRRWWEAVRQRLGHWRDGG